MDIVGNGVLVVYTHWKWHRKMSGAQKKYSRMTAKKLRRANGCIGVNANAMRIFDTPNQA